MNRLVEIRAYALKPGTTAEFHHLVVCEAVPMVRAFGMDVVAFGASAHGTDGYFLIRAFDDAAHRERQQHAFYGSEPWLRGPREAIIACIDHHVDTVLWLAPSVVDGLRAANDAASFTDAR